MVRVNKALGMQIHWVPLRTSTAMQMTPLELYNMAASEFSARESRCNRSRSKREPHVLEIVQKETFLIIP